MDKDQEIAELKAALSRAREETRELRDALQELTETTTLPFPPFDAGEAAQNAWAERKGAALYQARRALALPGHAPTSSIYLCSQHGGYGFVSDCQVCNPSTSPAFAGAAPSTTPGRQE